ncbi:MAG: hypothetical protein AAGE94_14345 [Acidobacteriota bacterium]
MWARGSRRLSHHRGASCCLFNPSLGLASTWRQTSQKDAFGAYDASSSMLVAWQSLDDSSGGILGRIYDAAGQPNCEFWIDDTTQSRQHDPEIVATPADLVVTWESRSVDFRRAGGRLEGPSVRHRSGVARVDPEVMAQRAGERRPCV